MGSADFVLTHRTITYTAQALRGNGSVEAATPTWTSSNPAVATITNAGVMTTLTPGTTTITASQTYTGGGQSETIRGTKALGVTTNFVGTWDGTYRVRTCTQSGQLAAARWCESLGGAGAVLPAQFVIEQAGMDRTEARITLTLGSLQARIPGIVTQDGRLTADAGFDATANGVSVRVTISGWDTSLAAPTEMVGRWTQRLAGTGTGTVNMENEIVTLVRPAP
jgi:hypothetical protein